jgi:tetratricopeptide (TPR) repeat protein
MPLPRFLGLLAALAFVAIRASAQPAPTPEEVQQAQARWHEGKAFFDTGNFEAARVAFKQAYTVFPHPVFLQNLGEAELRAGRNVEAARHFEAFLRTSGAISAAQRDQARKSLKKAAEKLGSVLVDTNAEDAEIRVDDEVVGRSPLGGLAWYVEPGKHVVVARKEGYLDGSEQVFVPAGLAKTVVVRVQRVAASSEDAPGGAATRTARADGPPAASHEEESPALEPKVLVVAGGAALTAVALTVGTVYALRVGSDRTHIDDAKARIGTASCGDRSAPADACADLAQYATRLPTDRNVRDVALVSAGVVGGATVAALLFWPSPSTGPRAGPPVSAWIQGGHYGVIVSGRF